MLKSVLDGYVLVKELMPIGDPICNSILANRDTYVKHQIEESEKEFGSTPQKGTHQPI